MHRTTFQNSTTYKLKENADINKPLVHTAVKYSEFRCSVDIRAFQILHVYEPEITTYNKVTEKSLLVLDTNKIPHKMQLVAHYPTLNGSFCSV